MDQTPVVDIIRAYQPTNEQERQDKRMMLHYAELFDDLLLRENEIAHFTASAWICNKQHDKVLMAFHNIYQSWAWTGGHADGDADLLGVALREAREETGIADVRALSERPLSLEIIPVDPHFKRGRFVVAHQHLNITYLLEADEGQSIHSREGENSAVAWFSPGEAIAKSTEPEMRIIYQKLIDNAALLI